MIVELKLILETLSSLGIDEAIIQPDENGSVIRAANKEGNVIVYDVIPESLSEHPMGIQSVRGLLSRIDLFDIDKCTASLDDDGNCIRDIKIKQGRKSATFRFATPKNIHAPNAAPEADNSDEIVLNKEYVKYLGKAITAMSFTGDKEERTISIHGTDKGLSVKISDGEDDSFDEVVEEITTETQRGSWEVAPFQRVMGRSSEYNTKDGSAVLTINSFGIAIFDLSYFKAMIVPMAS